MRRLNVFSRTLSTHTPTGTLCTGIFVAGMACVAACGSDKQTTATTTTTQPSGTTTTVMTPTTGSPTGTTTVTDANNTTTTTTGNTAVNATKTGQEPTLIPTSAAVNSTPKTGTAVNMPYLQLSYNPNATNLAKSYALTAYDYDPCIFGFDHGYKVFPSGLFNFVGFYLVNATPGAALTAGTYTVGSTGTYVDTTASGSGYGITSCKATSYAQVSSGTVTISSLPPTVGSGSASGTLNVTMSDGSIFSGQFTSGVCTGGSTTQPTPPVPDPYSCATLN